MWFISAAASLLVVAVTFASAASAAPPGVNDLAGFDGMHDRWTGLMKEFEVPGMAIAIVKDGKIASIDTFGIRNLENSAAPDADTMFYIASITKTYLATALCALRDDGKLNLDDPVKKYLPRFELASESAGADKITIRDLLTHRAGLAGSEAIVLLDAFTGEITEDRYYHWLAKVKPQESTTYSNINYTLLGRVVEAVSGKSWRDFLADRVFQPAGLTRTTGYASKMYQDKNCAMPMELVDGQWRVCRLQKSDNTMHAAGGLGASARDAARWLVLHLNDGEIDGKRVISAESAREMRMLQGKLAQKQGSIRIMEGFGLGWQVGTFHGTPLCSHGGGYAGTATYYAMLPEKNCGLAILMNASGAAGGLMDVIAVDILDRLMEGDERIDVVDGYRKRLAEHQSRAPIQAAEQKAQAAKPFELTRPAPSYAGRYASKELGTITITPDGERLKVALGECELDVSPSGPDAFEVLGPTARGTKFRFNATDPSTVSVITLDSPEDGLTIEFRK